MTKEHIPKTTFRLTPAARRALSEWSDKHFSSMQSEINQSILFRAEQERLAAQTSSGEHNSVSREHRNHD